MACSPSPDDLRKELASLRRDRKSALKSNAQKHLNAEENLKRSHEDARETRAREMEAERKKIEAKQAASVNAQKTQQTNKFGKGKEAYAITERELELRIEKPELGNLLGKTVEDVDNLSKHNGAVFGEEPTGFGEELELWKTKLDVFRSRLEQL